MSAPEIRIEEDGEVYVIGAEPFGNPEDDLVIWRIVRRIARREDGTGTEAEEREH